MSSLTKCNWHSAERILKTHPDARVKPSGTERWPLAKELVDANGETLVWYAELPDRCRCG